MMTLSGFRQPALSGMSSSIRVRNTYSTAARHTAAGALKLLACCAEVPVKSMSRAPARAIDPHLHLDHRAVVHLVRVTRRRCSAAMTRRTASSALSWTWHM